MMSGVRFTILYFFLGAIFLTLSVVAAAANPIEKSGEKEIDVSSGKALCKLSVTASSGEINVAESLDLTIEVLEPPETVAEFPTFSQLGFATDFTERSQRFRVTDISELTREKLTDGGTIIRQKYTLEPWLSGDYAILPIMVSFYPQETDNNESLETPEKESSPSSAWRAPLASLMTEGIRVKVAPLPPDRHELSDILGQVDLEKANLLEKERRTENKSDEELRREEEEKNEAAAALQERRFPWWIIWLLLAVMVVAPVIWYLGRKKIQKYFSNKRVPPHVLALQEFDELQKKELLKHGEIKEFYYELSFILRKYIGGQFRIFADKQTSEEFFQQLMLNNPFDTKSEQILRDFADLADTVKYSLYRPDSRLGEESFQVARSFVHNTKPVEEEK